jgi:hypothetical protein
MAQDHSTAAVAGDPEIIQHYGSVFAFIDASFVLIPIVGDYFST